MKYLLTTLLTAFIALSFIGCKCEHVYVLVEQAEIKIKRTGLSLLGGQGYFMPEYPSGKQEGQNLICVKCFHQRKQVIDYGQYEPGHSLTWGTIAPCTGSTISIDTLNSFVHIGTGGSRVMVLKTDTLMWSK